MLPISDLFPLRVMEITLQFTEASKVRLYHQASLSAWLRYLTDDYSDDYERYLSIDAPESGCTRFQAGNDYRFSIMAVAGGEALLEILLNRLKRLPQGVVVTDKRAAFRDNLRFVSAQDLFSQATVQQVDELTPFTFAQLEQQAELWLSQEEGILRWLSPVRLLLPKPQRAHRKDEMRFCRYASHMSFELLNDRLHDTLAYLLRQRGVAIPPRQSDKSPRLLKADAFWLDFDYWHSDGRRKPMGGLLGTLQLDMQAMPFEQVCQFVLGQYVGIGQRRVFGWGRYRLETVEGQATLLRTLSANSLLDACTSERVLEAYQRTTPPQSPPNKGGEVLDDSPPFQGGAGGGWDEKKQHMLNLRERWITGRYQVPPLQEKRVFKRKTLQELQIPPFTDRILQRTVAQVLAPTLDSIMYQGNFGFRQGHSRQQAVKMIQTAYEQGYRWVFESDVNDFFDSISWSQLHTRLVAFFGDDPVIHWIMAWVQAPLQKLGQLVARSAGLPQGSPLSPVLANIMLDELSRSGIVSRADVGSELKLVRFADDFVVLCRERGEHVAPLVNASNELMYFKVPVLSGGKVELNDLDVPDGEWVDVFVLGRREE